jgi:hypothetical protein
MPIHTKKAAVRNREVFVNNQISNIFVNNNGIVSINQDAIKKYESKTATTSLAISGTYRIPLVSSTSGNQVFNTSANLLYDTNTNTLQAQNLTTTYLPQCSQVPTQTNQLVNKAYLDQYVGSYNQLWIYEDWMNSDVSGNLKWVIHLANGGGAREICNINNNGGVRLTTNSNAGISYYLNSNSFFYPNVVKCIRFLITPFPINTYATAYIRIGLVRYYSAAMAYSDSSNVANSAVWVYDKSNNSWGCYVNSTTASKYYNGGNLQGKTVLFEIEFNNSKPTFYITVVGETTRTLVYTETINSVGTYPLTPNVVSQVGSETSTIDIKYMDITYNKI